jgi:methionyl-tRNA formyltransferase
MKVAILTTETLHHTYFVAEMSKRFDGIEVIAESNIARTPFETHHTFESERDHYEREVFFKGTDVALADVAPTFTVGSVNDAESVEYLRAMHPDIVLVFGTRKIKNEIITISPGGIINLHGGDPEKYRGLDSHLWAIYHRDFGALATTLHRVNEDLDDGEIILQAVIPVQRGMRIHELRLHNTKLCVKLSVAALTTHLQLGHFVAWPQRGRGRYYSFMPAVLKEICCNHFHAYTDKL